MSRNSRIIISVGAVLIPLALFLRFGLYGSFSFSFSVPIIWQIGLLGESINTLGIRKKSFYLSTFVGMLTGLILAFFGGFLLKAFGITGYSIDQIRNFTPFVNSFKDEVGYKLLTGNGITETLLYLFYCIFLVGLGEEIFWRGFIQRKISKHLSKNLAIWVTAFLFGMAHIYIFILISLVQGFYLLGLIILVGGVWGYLREYFDNIWSPAISHGIIAFVVWKYFVFL